MSDFDPQVDEKHYRDLAYDTKTRFISYWHQIKLIVDAQPESVMEVGIGNGFVARYLAGLGLRVHTVDADERLEPDTVATLDALPFGDGQFDMSCCFEVLEHLPWEQFAPSVAELRRVAKRDVLLSLPDRTPYLRVDVEWRFHRNVVHRLRDLPNLRPERHAFDGQHHWEVGKSGFPLERIVKVVEGQGLQVVDAFRVFEDPYHRFLVCRVR